MKIVHPQNAPVQSVWAEKDKEWVSDPAKVSKTVKEYRSWWPDGSLATLSFFNEEGLLEGIVQRFHPNGELAQWSRYHNGKVFGKQVFTRATSGISTENLQFPQIPKGLFRWDMIFLEGVIYNVNTYYTKEGLKEPIATNDDGYSIDLSNQLYKLLPDTSFSMIEDILQPVFGRAVKVGKKAMVVYGGPIEKGSSHHWIKIDNTKKIIVSASEIEKKLCLAVDRIDHNMAKRIELGIW